MDVPKDGTRTPAPTKAPAATATPKPQSDTSKTNGTENSKNTGNTEEIPVTTQAPAGSKKTQSANASGNRSKNDTNGNVDQGGITHLFDDGSVLVEQTPTPEKETSETEETKPSAIEPVEVKDDNGSKEWFFVAVICVIAVLAIGIAEAVHREIKKKD